MAGGGSARGRHPDVVQGGWRRGPGARCRDSDGELTIGDPLALRGQAPAQAAPSLALQTIHERDRITIERIADGKIVAVWAAWDELGLLRQLGAVPEPVGNRYAPCGIRRTIDLMAARGDDEARTGAGGP